MSDMVRVAYAGPSGSLTVADDEGTAIIITCGDSAVMPRDLAESTVLAMPGHHLTIHEDEGVGDDAPAIDTFPDEVEDAGATDDEEAGSVSQDNLQDESTPTE